jgi:RNA polymerase sigma-70 factor (ECF subfamily)
MNDLNDTALIERALGGDAGAFGVLVERYSGRVFSLVRRICPGREDAEEVVQDTFLKVYRQLTRFRRESSFSSWLYRIAWNTALSRLRKNRAAGHFTAWEDGRFRLDDEAEPPWEDADTREEQLERLEAALDRLPPEDRFLLLLFYREDKPVREIAHITGMSEGQVKTRLHRIRKRLGGQLTIDN